MDLLEAMLGIQESSKIIREINHTFICSIPKVPIPEFIVDYGPISLCNVTHKVLANLICDRIKG